MGDFAQRLSSAIADRYRIERQLGEGGMATVYLAEDLKHQRKVALKVLRPELAAVIGADRFVQEITTTASLQHPNILPLFDSGRVQGSPEQGGGEFLFYVMPYVEGETLRDKLNRDTQLGIDEAVRIASEVADALDYAHRHGVIHRDIKPENILLHDGRPVVADFGIALALSAAAGGRMTETGLSLGTPHYMSPEQATAEKHVTNRSDIYSLGSVLYEMLTGEPPHTGASAQAIIMRIVTEHARPVTAIRKSVPAHVAAAVAKSIEKLPADRFETAKAFSDALHNATFGTTAATTAGTFTMQGAEPRRRVAMYAVSAVAVAALAVAGWSLSKQPATPDGGVVRYRLPIAMEIGLGNDFGSQLAISPSGSQIAYVTGVGGVPKIWLLDRDKLEPRVLPGTEQAHQVSFSPDGSHVVFVTWDRKLKIASLGGEPPSTLSDTGLIRGGAAWADDGYVYFGAGSSVTGTGLRGLARVSAKGGPLETVTHLDSAHNERSHRFPVALPGSRGIVFVVTPERLYDAQAAEIAVVDLKTKKHRILMKGTAALWSPTGHLLVLRADGALLAVPFDPNKLEVTGTVIPVLDGVAVEVLSSSDLSISASGTLVYEPGGGNSAAFELAWVGRDGRMTSIDNNWTGLFRQPSLSPNGKRIAVTMVGAESQIWIKQLDNGPNSKLTFEGRSNTRASWMGESAVAYISDAASTSDVFSKRADGSAPAAMLLRTAALGQEVEIARTGPWAVARIGVSPAGDLYKFRPGVDSTPTLLFESKFDDVTPALSTDSRWLAYASNESGRTEVYVRPFPEASTAKWQVSTNGGSEPLWSHTGRELFYRNANNDLVSVTVNPGTTFSFGEQRVLFSMNGTAPGDGRRQYDVSPDDQRFLVVKARGDLQVPVIVVDNYLKELRQKLGAK